MYFYELSVKLQTKKRATACSFSFMKVITKAGLLFLQMLCSGLSWRQNILKVGPIWWLCNYCWLGYLAILRIPTLRTMWVIFNLVNKLSSLDSIELGINNLIRFMHTCLRKSWASCIIAFLKVTLIWIYSDQRSFGDIYSSHARVNHLLLSVSDW